MRLLNNIFINRINSYLMLFFTSQIKAQLCNFKYFNFFFQSKTSAN